MTDQNPKAGFTSRAKSDPALLRAMKRYGLNNSAAMKVPAKRKLVPSAVVAPEPVAIAPSITWENRPTVSKNFDFAISIAECQIPLRCTVRASSATAARRLIIQQLPNLKSCTELYTVRPHGGRAPALHLSEAPIPMSSHSSVPLPDDMQPDERISAAS